jgi:hypothetical protein
MAAEAHYGRTPIFRSTEGILMTIADLPAVQAVEIHDERHDVSAGNAMPRDCDPNRHLNWRLRYALHLGRNGGQHFMTNTDPWVPAAIDFQVAHENDWENRKPTLVDHAIVEAFSIWQHDSLVKHVLEARLLNQQQPLEIFKRCHLARLTIFAYSNLLFDVCGVPRKGIWFLQQFRQSRPIDNVNIAMLGLTLKQMACFNTSEDLESRIDVLLRLDGNTLANGLPDRSAPEFARALGAREALANPLLPSTQQTKKLVQRYHTATARDVQSGRTSDEAIGIAVEILRKAKIPAALRDEIRRVRKLNLEAAELTAAVGSSGDSASSFGLPSSAVPDPVRHPP